MNHPDPKLSRPTEDPWDAQDRVDPAIWPRLMAYIQGLPVIDEPDDDIPSLF